MQKLYLVFLPKIFVVFSRILPEILVGNSRDLYVNFLLHLSRNTFRVFSRNYSLPAEILLYNSQEILLEVLPEVLADLLHKFLSGFNQTLTQECFRISPEIVSEIPPGITARFIEWHFFHKFFKKKITKLKFFLVFIWRLL